jgi:acyl CoA:acetate/3-ketoacid CoA transferase
MAIDKRVTSAAQALADVADGARVFITGFGGAGFPNVLIRALRESGRKNLTLIVNSATHRYSLTHELIEAGLVCKVVCSAARGQGKDLSPFEDRAHLSAPGHLSRMHSRRRCWDPRILHAGGGRHRARPGQGGAPLRRS